MRPSKSLPRTIVKSAFAELPESSSKVSSSTILVHRINFPRAFAASISFSDVGAEIIKSLLLWVPGISVISTVGAVDFG